jgi:flagellar biosynthesis protein FlhB
MAESSIAERTVEPTPRRIERARKEGQIAFSRELVSGVVLASACLVLAVGGRAGLGGLVIYLRTALDGAVRADSLQGAIQLGLDALISTLWLPVGVVCLAVIVASLAQTRGNVAPARVEGARLRPRLARVIGREGIVVAAMDGCKLVALCTVAYLVLRPCLPALSASAGAQAPKALHILGAMAYRLGMGLAIVMLVFGLADYGWQVARHRHRMRMTHDEAKREHRESEGAPELKAERRRILHALNAMSWEGSLGAREFVVTDPGVVAVALCHSGAVEDVPVVLGKGERTMARRIEDAARTAAVPIIEDRSLAAALALLDEGGEIPESLYWAVAEAIVKARWLA